MKLPDPQKKWHKIRSSEPCGGPTQTCICSHSGHSHRFAQCDSCACQRFEARPCRHTKGRCRTHNPERAFQLTAQIDPATLEQWQRENADIPPRNADPLHCGIYFIRCERFVKIGWSFNARRRLIALQLAVPFELEILAFIPCDWQTIAQTEARFHKRFKRLHQRGEWFRLEGHLARFIIKHQERIRATAVA